eukprot:TRINITY_DN5991_c0_g2_i2.p1 TRINITY_DN5991_c0_g2~~TRINITY_DN5991_c0_g2_i2.p1  ORF type:complete len:340 (+),score=32.06 TRINITY_DN5991_c0_g2_i2:58-1077(+)
MAENDLEKPLVESKELQDTEKSSGDVTKQDNVERKSISPNKEMVDMMEAAGLILPDVHGCTWPKLKRSLPLLLVLFPIIFSEMSSWTSGTYEITGCNEYGTGKPTTVAQCVTCNHDSVRVEVVYRHNGPLPGYTVLLVIIVIELALFSYANEGWRALILATYGIHIRNDERKVSVGLAALTGVLLVAFCVLKLQVTDAEAQDKILFCKGLLSVVPVLTQQTTSAWDQLSRIVPLLASYSSLFAFFYRRTFDLYSDFTIKTLNKYPGGYEIARRVMRYRILASVVSRATIEVRGDNNSLTSKYIFGPLLRSMMWEQQKPIHGQIAAYILSNPELYEEIHD